MFLVGESYGVKLATMIGVSMARAIHATLMYVQQVHCLVT
jgi:hypothetical protein